MGCSGYNIGGVPKTTGGFSHPGKSPHLKVTEIEGSQAKLKHGDFVICPV